MRKVAAATLLVIATLLGALTPVQAQICTVNCVAFVPPPPPSTSSAIPPLGIYALGSIGCAATAPIVGTIILGREMTASEVGRSTLSCLLGPVGWLLGAALFPVEVVAVTAPTTPTNPPNTSGPSQPRGHNIHIPPRGEIHFVPNEILVEFDGADTAYLAAFARELRVTQLESVTFALTGRTLQRWRIDGARSVVNTLRALPRFSRVSFAQANFRYLGQQGAPAASRESTAGAGPTQYVVSKLHLLEAHRISGGDNVLVAVLDSKIDTAHPDLAGVVVDEYDVTGAPPVPHAHGTGMAGAIASHAKLLGVAPKVKLLAIRAFTGDKQSANSTTFNILKGIDWAATKHARIINMSFAGPADPALHAMLAQAHGHGIVLIAAVGNAGPSSPPLYPAADASVIGVTATDANDQLLPQANRGPQVAVAAPGVDILEPAPDGGYQITSGTSVAAAHASGVAAILLARNPNLSPDEVRAVLTRTAHVVPGKSNDTGAGVIDALDAVNSLRN